MVIVVVFVLLLVAFGFLLGAMIAALLKLDTNTPDTLFTVVAGRFTKNINEINLAFGKFLPLTLQEAAEKMKKFNQAFGGMR